MALLSRNRAPVASLGSRRCRAGVMLGQNGDHDSRIRPSIVVPVGISPSPWFASGSLICTIATAIASGRPAHRPFRGLLGVHSRCGLHTRAVTLVTAIRGLQTFRHLHACPGCFRLERIAGWALHPLEKRRLVTAHVETGHSATAATRVQNSTISANRSRGNRPQNEGGCA